VSFSIPGYSEETNRPETVDQVCIRVEGKLYPASRPARHADVLHWLTANGVKGFREQGFMSSLGRFLTREQALQLAKESRQTFMQREPIAPPKLYSEDLW